MDRAADEPPAGIAMPDGRSLIGVAALAADRLHRPAALSALSFRTTAEIEPVDGLVGQHARSRCDRVRHPGAQAGLQPVRDRLQRGAHAAGGRERLRAAAREKPPPPDWVYVNNFREPHRPIAIELPAGRAFELRDVMRELVDDLKTALPAVLESEDYQTRREAIDQAFQARRSEGFSALRDKAAEKGIVILRTPVGFALAPSRDGQVVPPDEFGTWPEAKRREVQEISGPRACR